MFDDEDEILPPREEEIPKSLERKWEEQEKREGLMQCRSCKKQILAASSFCAYCGDPVGMPSGRIWLIGTVFLLLFVIIFIGARMSIHF